MSTLSIDVGLQRLRQARADVLKRASVRSVHALRVACARLRVWAWIARQRHLTAELRWLRAIAGLVRDLDLQRRRPGVRERRQQAQQALVGTLKSRRVLQLLRVLSAQRPLVRKEAKRRVRKLTRQLLRNEPSWHSLREAHRFRRAVRRVRYGLEWVAKPTGHLGPLQDALGRAHDLALTGRGRVAKRRIVETLAVARRIWRKQRSALARWAD